MISRSVENLQHYIIPLKNLKLDNDNFTYLFDDELKISLKKFDYENNTERVDADNYSTFDQGQLKMNYAWGLRFDCTTQELPIFIENVNLLMLAFRILGEADCSYEYILNVSNVHYSIKNPDEWKRAINNEKHSTNFTIATLAKIKDGYLKLQSLRRVSPRTKHSIQFIYLGYISYYWMQAFILYMASLESLVSPDIKSDKITSIIISRILKLISTDAVCSKNQLNNIYELRSDIVHGKITTDLQMKNEMPKLVKLQRVVLLGFRNILKEDFLTIYKNEESKEIFYNY